MTIITPAGKKDFVWSPMGSDMVKTASKGSVQKSDKDLLFEAAQRVVKAQSMLDVEETESSPCEGLPCEEKALGEENGLDLDKAIAPPPSGVAEAMPAAGSSDAVQAVQELADKASKAEEVASKVQDALTKVEEAVQGVKDAVGASTGESMGAPEEVVLDVEVEDETEGEGKGKGFGKGFGKEDKDGEKDEDKEVEIEIEDEDEDEDDKDEKKDDDKDEKDEKKDDIVQESITAAKKAVEMKTASSDDLVSIAKISPTTRKKVTSFWKDELGYDPAYVKLMTTDYEK